MKTVAIIMAGGAGERFWPMSRKAYPKQLLPLDSDRTMLHSSIERVSTFIDKDDIFIVTVNPLKKSILKIVQSINPENVIEEPFGRNTAACLTLMSAHLENKYKDDVVMIVLTADHFIRDIDSFALNCRHCIEFASQEEALITFGIRPTRADTGFGYIEVGQPASNTVPVYKVDAFREKPDAKTAEHFLSSGGFLWNSGMFVWKNSTFRNGLYKHLPVMANSLVQIENAYVAGDLDEKLPIIYSTMEKVSIDVGLMEASENVYVVRASFDWDDVGAWTALKRILDPDSTGNAKFGNTAFLKSEDCIVYNIDNGSTPPRPKLLVGYNLNNIIVVNTPDVTLVLPADDDQKIKEVIAWLRDNGYDAYL